MDFITKLKMKHTSQKWWDKPLVPALRGQRQVDLCVFIAGLVYTGSSRLVSQDYIANPVLGKKEKKDEKK